MGTSPSSSVAMEVKAAKERSRSFSSGHVGHASATVTETLLPLLVFVSVILRPQLDDSWERSP